MIPAYMVQKQYLEYCLNRMGIAEGRITLSLSPNLDALVDTWVLSIRDQTNYILVELDQIEVDMIQTIDPGFIDYFTEHHPELFI